MCRYYVIFYKGLQHTEIVVSIGVLGPPLVNTKGWYSYTVKPQNGGSHQRSELKQDPGLSHKAAQY